VGFFGSQLIFGWEFGGFFRSGLGTADWCIPVMVHTHLGVMIPASIARSTEAGPRVAC
jgi:hypothetical protein